MNPYEAIAAPILARYPGLEADDLQFAPPPNFDSADLALRTFLAAKKLHMPPPKLAGEIAETVDFGSLVLEKDAVGPYLNFKLDRSAFAADVVSHILQEGERYGSAQPGAGKKILIEHTSINPNASPHVGRARNAMIGDSLVRLFRFEGYEVDVHYYVNDMGRQIGLLVLVCDDLESLNFDDILEKYVEANDRAETDPEFAAAGYELLVKMEAGDPETRRRFFEVTEHCLKGQLGVLARLGIEYDSFDRESKYLEDPNLELVVSALRKAGAAFTDEDDRLVVDLCKIGHTRDEGRYFVLMRANGSSMYGYRDLAYTIDKMSSDVDLNLWILGEDHKLYAQQQGLILAAAGKAVPEVIHYAYILLKEGKMSTREGKVVLLSDFLDEAAARARVKVDEQCHDLNDDERKAIADKVAVAAVRFAILKVNLNKNVIFDWESSLSFSGDTGPYVQYSCARVSSILRKAGDVPSGRLEEFVLESDPEWALLSKLIAFTEVVEACDQHRNVAPIAQYALDVARLFTTFYHDCHVLNADTEAQRMSRLRLCMATRHTLANALSILGIAALERM